MDRDIQIRTGIAGVGETHRLLDEYRDALRTGAAKGHVGRTLWLTPTNQSRRQILAELPSDSLPVCFAPNVLTFPAFAERLLLTSDEPAESISPTVRQRLIRTIIDDLHSQKRLPYFAPIASTFGFLQLVSSFISELKREEIWPERFEEVVTAESSSDKDRELALIYATYQNRLLAARRYDSEGCFWSARDVAERAGLGPFSKLAFVVVDGFTDFTHTQYELLVHLARDSQAMRIALPLESPLERTDLFAKSAAACERLTSALGGNNSVRVIHTGDDARETGRPSLGKIAASLFANPRSQVQDNDAGGIEVFAAAGQIREIEFLTGRVKRMLLEGIPADDIVIAFRLLEDDVADLIHERFTAAGIPFEMTQGTPLGREPLLKALFDIVRLELEDWPFTRLMAVLRSNFFGPDWGNSGTSASAVAAFLRNRKLHSQRRLILRILTRERDHFAEIADDARLGPLDSALTLLERLDLATKRLRGKTDFAGWVERIVQLARELGITPTRDDPSVSADGPVWDLFERSLFDVAHSELFGETASSEMGLGEFFAALGEIVETAETRVSTAGPGTVRILAADGVRNIDVPHLFLAGLTEASFPSNRGEDCLYGEAERRRLNERGLKLGHRTSHSEDEMLLFYGVVTRARETLVLSYPEISTSGKPVFASPYIKAIRDLFTPESLPIQHIGTLDPLPARNAILSDSDLRRVATAEVHDGQPSLFAAMCDRPQTKTVARNILYGVDANVARFRTQGWTVYEGRIADGHLQKLLAKRFPPDYQFSATQLEKYARCGFRFLMSEVLKIDALEPPHVATDHLSRGVLVHNVLSMLHGNVEEPTTPVSVEVSATFRQHVDELLGQRINDTELQRALTQVEKRLLHEWADEYGANWNEYLGDFSEAWDSAPSPRHLETPFGDPPGDDPTQPSPDRLPPLELGTGTAATFVRGRIDRIDLGNVDSQPVFNVIDYKSGKPPKFALDDVQTGHSLQLALYTLAVLRFDLAGKGATAFQMGYWSLKETGFVNGMKGGRKKSTTAIDEAVMQSLETTLHELIPQLAEGIRTGWFPVDSDDADCTSRCAYSRVCRVTQVRPIRDTCEKPPKLTVLSQTTESP